MKTRKTVEGEKVTHHIALGDGHTLIVMFDKDAKCSGIQRVRGEDEASNRPTVPTRLQAELGNETKQRAAEEQLEFPIQVVTVNVSPYYGSRDQIPRRVRGDFEEWIDTSDAEIKPVFVGAGADD